MIKITAVWFAGVLSVAPAFTQNLLVNPGFDLSDQLTGWTCTSSYGVESWSTHDRQDSTDSGSMEHNIPVTQTANQKILCSQCVPVQELWSYAMSSWYYWPNVPGLSAQGSTRIGFNFHVEVDCTDQAVLGPMKLGYPHYDTWSSVETIEGVAPAGAQAAEVYFVTWKDVADHEVRARVDDLDFSSTILFGDGFESGLLDAWSASVP